MRITVLYGGEGAEREVSLCSGKCVADALQEKGHEVWLCDLPALAALEGIFPLCAASDAVFLALHGGFGEDGRLQAALESKGLRQYTGSGAEASALCMKKSSAKEAVQRVRVPVARGALLTANAACPLAFPLAAKPDAGGSSVGFCVVEDAKMLTRVLENGPLLCEEYLPGREYSVGVLEGRALPPVELCPVGGVYDYAHKYTEGATDERCPAPVAPHVRALLQTRALIAFSALGLRDYARIDFKENAQGDPVFLEANTLPGMTGTSLLPLAARTAGLSFAALCERMAACAAARKS